MPRVTAWKGHPARLELLALYAEVELHVAASSCACSTTTERDDARCCQFRVTGREPYPSPVELAEVDHAIRARGVSRPTGKKKLVMIDERGSCPLLSEEGRCTIYASRPFGCRTFFCAGHEPSRRDRVAIQAIGRRISDLAARVFPTMPLPRPLTRALAGRLPSPAK